MSCKKDWLNKRKYRKRQRTWSVPKDFRHNSKLAGTRYVRARNRQLMRESEFELLLPYLRNAAWYYW